MNRSFGYVTRRRRRGRTARQRRRNRRLYSYDRIVGMGRFAAAAHRERIMDMGEFRSRIENLYSTPLGRQQLSMMPRYARTNNRPGPTEPAWRGVWQRNRASMTSSTTGALAPNAHDPALVISQIGIPVRTDHIRGGPQRSGASWFNYKSN